jgi:hypothetical protein
LPRSGQRSLLAAAAVQLEQQLARNPSAKDLISCHLCSLKTAVKTQDRASSRKCIKKLTSLTTRTRFQNALSAAAAPVTGTAGAAADRLMHTAIMQLHAAAELKNTGALLDIQSQDHTLQRA